VEEASSSDDGDAELPTTAEVRVCLEANTHRSISVLS
jgi:hypothetical protein